MLELWTSIYLRDQTYTIWTPTNNISSHVFLSKSLKAVSLNLLKISNHANGCSVFLPNVSLLIVVLAGVLHLPFALQWWRRVERASLQTPLSPPLRRQMATHQCHLPPVQVQHHQEQQPSEGWRGIEERCSGLKPFPSHLCQVFIRCARA